MSVVGHYFPGLEIIVINENPDKVIFPEEIKCDGCKQEVTTFIIRWGFTPKQRSLCEPCAEVEGWV